MTTEYASVIEGSRDRRRLATAYRTRLTPLRAVRVLAAGAAAHGVEMPSIRWGTARHRDGWYATKTKTITLSRYADPLTLGTVLHELAHHLVEPHKPARHHSPLFVETLDDLVAWWHLEGKTHR